MKTKSDKFTKKLILTVCGLSLIVGCGDRPNSDKATIKLTPPPGKPTNTATEKATADNPTALRISEMTLNLIRFARFQVLHFYDLKPAGLPANNCFLPNETAPLARWDWTACPVGKTGVAYGTTSATPGGTPGSFADITTVLNITPIKTIKAPSFEFTFALTNLVKVEAGSPAGTFNIRGNLAVTVVAKTLESKQVKVYDFQINQLIFIANIAAKDIPQINFGDAGSRLYDGDKDAVTRTTKLYSYPPFLTIAGDAQFLKGNFDIEFALPGPVLGRQKISFDEKNLTTTDNVTRDWECKTVYGCLPLPIPTTAAVAVTTTGAALKASQYTSRPTWSLDMFGGGGTTEP